MKKTYILLFTVVVFCLCACKKLKDKVEPAPEPEPISVWKKDNSLPQLHFTYPLTANGLIHLQTNNGAVFKITWDSTATDKLKAFDVRKTNPITLPFSFTMNGGNGFQKMNERLLVYYDNNTQSTTLKIRALDNNESNSILEIAGKSIDPDFYSFESSGYSWWCVYAVRGNYILVPYRRQVSNAPNSLHLALIKLAPRPAGLAALANDPLSIEKIIPITNINPNAYFGGRITDIAPTAEGFIVSNYGSNTPQTCTIDLDGKIVYTAPITSSLFFANSPQYLMGFKQTDKGETGLYHTTNGGKTWIDFPMGLSAGLGTLRFYNINGNLIGVAPRQLLLITMDIKDLKMNFNMKEITNEGLPNDVVINGILPYGPELVALTTSKGIYTKKIKDLLRNK